MSTCPSSGRSPVPATPIMAGMMRSPRAGGHAAGFGGHAAGA